MKSTIDSLIVIVNLAAIVSLNTQIYIHGLLTLYTDTLSQHNSYNNRFCVVIRGLNPGPPALHASTLPLGYRGGGVLRFENALNFCDIIIYKTAVMSANAFHIRLILLCHFMKKQLWLLLNLDIVKVIT